MARHRCEAVFGWYLEPYGFVAALVGNITGVPVFIRHAGSDLARLSANRDLHEAYRWALGSATGLIVTNEGEFERKYGGMPRRRLRLRRPRLPEEFSAGHDLLQIAEIVPQAEDWFNRLGLADEVILSVHRLNRKPFVEGTFTIGTYGKVGETKGSYDLIEALASLADRGATFNFLTVASGTRSELNRYYAAILRNPRLTERSWILPPLVPWRIPSFLRRCQAVCFLERDFPIQFHGPLIPREVLSSGACLVCSREVADKREYRRAFVDRRNAVIIEDPRDRAVLSSRLLELITNADLAWSLGRQGELLSRFWEEELPCLEDSAQHLIEQIQAGSSAASGR
jgi:glycosyltransferase involved in cell wall biosynthesis